MYFFIFNIFTNKIGVLNGYNDEHSKMELEILIYQHGGKNVQYPNTHTNYIIAAKKCILLFLNRIL